METTNLNEVHNLLDTERSPRRPPSKVDDCFGMLHYVRCIGTIIILFIILLGTYTSISNNLRYAVVDNNEKSTSKYIVGTFREGPTKHVMSVNMMITLAQKLNRTFVEPCYATSGRLAACDDKDYVIPFCHIFLCNVKPSLMLRHRDFLDQNVDSTSKWVLTTAWGFEPGQRKVMESDFDLAQSDSADVLEVDNIIKETFTETKHLEYKYNLSYMDDIQYPEKPYSVLQWRSEKNINSACDYDEYIQCANDFRNEIEFHSKNMKSVYVIWDAHLDGDHNWGHLNIVIPRKHRQDASEIVMKQISDAIAIKRLKPSGNILKDMMVDHVIGSGGDKLVQCLEGECLKCSFESGFSKRLAEMFGKGSHIVSWGERTERHTQFNLDLFDIFDEIN